MVVLDPYYLFLALLALEELSTSIFSPDVACNGKFEIKKKKKITRFFQTNRGFD